MKAIYTPFLRAADATVKDASVRSRVLAAAVAVAVANGLALPTSAVDNVAAHFAANEQMGVARKIADVNESVVFDLAFSVELARSLWLVRYNAAHPVAKPIFSGPASFFEVFSGADRHIDETTCCFLTEHKQAIFTLANELCAILCANKGDDAPAFEGGDRLAASAMGTSIPQRPFN